MIRITNFKQTTAGLSHPNTLRWRHNGCDGVSNHQPHDCLLNSLFGRRSMKTAKFRVTGLCAGNSPGTGEYPAQMASNAENVSIWWRHHGASPSEGTGLTANPSYNNFLRLLTHHRPSDAVMCKKLVDHWFIMTCGLFGTKPLSAPMLAFC